MCLICDGFTLDEVLTQFATAITHAGFVVQGVGDPSGPPDRPGWVYTVGLLDSADHPELIIAGAPLERSARLLQYLGDAVLAGERFQIGDTIMLGSELAHVGAVHPIQFRNDTFATWHNLAAEGLLREHSLDVVQVLAPASWIVGHRRQPVLAHPFARVDATPPRSLRSNARRHRKR